MRVSAMRCGIFDSVYSWLLRCGELVACIPDYVFVARFRFCHADRVGALSRGARPAQNCQPRKNRVLTKAVSEKSGTREPRIGSRSAQRFTPLPLPARCRVET